MKNGLVHPSAGDEPDRLDRERKQKESQVRSLQGEQDGLQLAETERGHSHPEEQDHNNEQFIHFDLLFIRNFF